MKKLQVQGGVWMVLLVLLVSFVGLGILALKYWYYLPGFLRDKVSPIEETRKIDWQRGPEKASLPAHKRPPNIVLILVDDLGFNDITFYGGGLGDGAAPTPYVDSIARDGVHFASGYSGNATCAPSRAAIMTGRYATRSGFEFTPVPTPFSMLIWMGGLFLPRQSIFHWDEVANRVEPKKQALPAEEITIPEVLATQGYHNVMIGKWHLGGTETTKPNAQGFDEFLGFYPGAALFLPEDDENAVNAKHPLDPIDKFLWPNSSFAVRYNDSPRFKPASYMTDYFADQAVEVIEANRNRPFFLFLSLNTVHTPLQALKSDYDALENVLPDHRERVYGAMIVSMDRAVGKVMNALEDQGLTDNTIVVFTSDNGGAGYVGLQDINAPYRGWKATFYEGGIRVPFFIKWPARITAGSSYKEPVGHVDLFATAAAAAGASLPDDRIIDGVDLVPVVRSKEAAHRDLFWRSGGYKVLLSGDWKLQVLTHPDRTVLYNLRRDPGERKDLAAKKPRRVEKMMKRLRELDDEQVQPLWASLVEIPISLDTSLSTDKATMKQQRSLEAGGEYIYWSN